ncbi:NAD(P)/FAD-dependent oxidoreductase [Methylocapsa sp. S129]|uniref:NAD(P)/FAD-dependent oxidoreductase n=1 Tax=Methylocapsa sp. S129 TaxID=1641869 RepID=UPI00131E2C5E|nr:NAD(P)/FAD-dependent oxidoreductase [Methylocapsa sp. S129]
MPPSPSESARPRVVIVGAGFGGLTAAKALAHAPVDITVIDQHNYHLFQPLLYQVATAALSPADIASPIRSVLARQKNTTVILAEVSGIDIAHKQVIAEDRRVDYDFLILATGARHAYFGHDDWAHHAPGLKRIDDATYLRRRILLAFEKAESEADPELRRSLLNFVVVGGGPTGVEMAGAIAELARKALKSDFRTIDPRSARIVLIEAAPRLLTPFDPRLSEAAFKSLERLGVEIRLNAAVTACDAEGVAIGAERIAAATIVWGAGVMASPAGLWLDAKTDRAGRVEVQPDLSLPGHSEVFVIGDTALVPSSDGGALPGIAPVAKQQGVYVAHLLIDRLNGRATPPFRYRDFGILATIGRKHAVIQMGPIKLSGFFAWLLWCFAHIYFLIGFRNRLAVVLNWGWNYFTFQRGTRLITGITGSRMGQMDEATPPIDPSLARAGRPGDADRPAANAADRPS